MTVTFPGRVLSAGVIAPVMQRRALYSVDRAIETHFWREESPSVAIEVQPMPLQTSLEVK